MEIKHDSLESLVFIMCVHEYLVQLNGLDMKSSLNGSNRGFNRGYGRKIKRKQPRHAKLMSDNVDTL